MPSLIWKRGVTKLNARAYRCLEQEQRNLGWWPFSYRLLDTLSHCYKETDEPLLDRLYASMEAGKGVYKITKRNRFERLNETLLEHLHMLPAVTCLQVRDIAVSSGITSLEWYRCLALHTPLRLNASDFYHRVWLVQQGGWTITFDEGNHPIQMAGYGMVMSIWRKEPWRLLINRMAQAYVNRFVVPAARRKLTQFRGSVVPTLSRAESRDVVEVSLFHPEVQQQSRDDVQFVIGQGDALQPLASQVHLIRVLNFLTPRHLDREQILMGWNALIASLVPGGLLIVGRTRDESDGALLVSAYQKTPQGQMHKCWQMDGPWECESGYALPNLI